MGGRESETASAPGWCGKSACLTVLPTLSFKFHFISQDRVELSAGAFYSGDKNSGSGSDGLGLHELRLNRLHDEPPKGRKA